MASYRGCVAGTKEDGRTGDADMVEDWIGPDPVAAYKAAWRRLHETKKGGGDGLGLGDALSATGGRHEGFAVVG